MRQRVVIWFSTLIQARSFKLQFSLKEKMYSDFWICKSIQRIYICNGLAISFRLEEYIISSSKTGAM